MFKSPPPLKSVGVTTLVLISLALLGAGCTTKLISNNSNVLNTETTKPEVSQQSNLPTDKTTNSKIQKFIIDGLPSVIRPADRLHLVARPDIQSKGTEAVKSVGLLVSGGARVSLNDLDQPTTSDEFIDKKPPFEFYVGMPYDLNPNSKVIFLFEGESELGNIVAELQVEVNVEVAASPTSLVVEYKPNHRGEEWTCWQGAKECSSDSFFRDHLYVLDNGFMFDPNKKKVMLFAPTMLPDYEHYSTATFDVKVNFSDGVVRTDIKAQEKSTLKYGVINPTIAGVSLEDYQVVVTAKSRGVTKFWIEDMGIKETMEIEVVGNYLPKINYTVQPNSTKPNSGNYFTKVGQSITIDASTTQDQDHDSVMYSWGILCKPSVVDSWQGQCDNLSGTVAASIQSLGKTKFTFTPRSPGFYDVNLKVDDGTQFPSILPTRLIREYLTGARAKDIWIEATPN